jgi:hypothetical protein
MKRYLVTIGFIGLCAGVFAADANLMKYVQVLAPSSSTNASVTGSAVDISAYKGNACFVVNTGTASATNMTVVITLEHSAAENFATAYTITNLAGTVGTVSVFNNLTAASSVAQNTYPIDLGRLKKYVRAKYTQSLADHSVPVSVTLVAPSKAE